MSVTISTTNKPLNPRAQDLSPKGYNRASLYSGKALDFDGVNDSVSVGTLSGDVYAATFLTYTDVDITAATITQTLINFATGSGNWAFKFGASTGFLTDETLSILLPNNARIGIDKTIPKGWNAWAVCWDGSTYKIYQNGQEQQTITSGTASVISMGLVELGKELSSQYYNGSLSNVKVYSTALTAAQVSDLYLNPEKIVPDGVANSALKLWLPMMEGAGTTAYDGSGNGNHGTISGATWVSGVGAPVAQTALVGWNKGTNLQPYSEQLDNSVWTQQAASITANVIASPDGYQNADELKVTSFTDYHQLAAVQNVASGTTYAFSVYAKQGSGTKYLQFAGAGLQVASQAPIFDLQNGVAYTAATKTVCLSASIQSVGNGWHRCSAVISAAGTAGMTLCFVGATNAFSGDSFAGNGTDSFYFWGTQVEAADSLGAYIPNHTSTQITTPVLLPQGLTSGRDITGVNSVSRNAYALNLDGKSWAEVHDNASLDITSAITLECWFDNTNAYDSIRYLFDKSDNSTNGFELRLFSQTGLQLVFRSLTPISITASIPSSGWVHIVGIYDGVNTKIYVNGVINSTLATTGTITSNTYPLTIGGDVQNSNYSLNKPIALPRIYNRALTATEVSRNYNADKSKFGL